MALDPAEFTDEQLARLREELKETILRMEEQIRRALQQGDGGRLSTEVAQRLLNNLLNEFEDLFGRVERELLGIGADVLEVVGTELEEAGIAAQLTTPSEALLRAQAGNALDELTVVRKERRAALRAAVVELSRSTVNPTEAVDALQAELRLTTAQTLTLVDTTVAGLDRTLTTEAVADNPDFLLLIDGPVDERTRPWCREHVGFLYTHDELAGMQNDVGPQPALTYCGGHNCRHRVLAIAREEWRSYPRWQGRPYPDEQALTEGEQRRLAA